MRESLGKKTARLDIRLLQKSPFPGYVHYDSTDVRLFYADMQKAREETRNKTLAYDVSRMTAEAENENYKDLEILDANETVE